MKKVSKKKQKEMLMSVSPAVYPLIYNGQEIEVNPALTIDQRKAFCEGVWSLYWNADKYGKFDYRPFLYEPAVRMMTLYMYTNLDIDLELSEANMALIQYSDAYESVISSLPAFYERDYHALCDAAKEYVDRKVVELNTMYAASAKSMVDDLIVSLLAKANKVVDLVEVDMQRYIDAGEKYPLDDIMSVVGKLKNLENSDGLVGGVLDFIGKRSGGEAGGGIS